MEGITKMKNLILREGQLLRVLRSNEVFEWSHISVGMILEVQKSEHTGQLFIVSPRFGDDWPLALSKKDGTLNDVCDDLTVHACPVMALPVGQNPVASEGFSKIDFEIQKELVKREHT